MSVLTLALLVCVGCDAATSGSTGADDPPATANVSTDPAGAGVTVAQRDFVVQLRLDGSSAMSDRIPLVSNPEFVARLNVLAGDEVERGATIGTVTVRPDLEQSLSGGASRINAARLRALLAREHDLVAPVAGEVAGDESSIENAGIDVVVPLTPVQALRFIGLEFQGAASIETTVGTRSVDCLAVWLETDSSGDVPQQVRCRLPEFVETATGLRATLELTSDAIPDAIVVPTRFIGYDAAQDAYVVTIEQDGQPEVVPVDVGATDGVIRVITSSLPVGAPLLLPDDSS